MRSDRSDGGRADGDRRRRAGPPGSWRILLALVLLVVSAVAPALVAARPANEIPVHHAPGDADALATPDGDEWARVPTVTMPLASAPSTVPLAEETSVERATVQAARTDSRLYLRLTWADPTADRNASGPRTFPDAAAVQLPVNTTTRPAIAMGSPRNLVNVWYWSADAGGQELLAGGPGTTTAYRDRAIDAAASRNGSRWALVVARDLAAEGSNRTAITLERDVDVAFAVWNGSQMERSGRKAVSEWHHFALGPGPQGPPYETLLWAIAGGAIAVVVFVTASAVRGT